MQIDDRKQKILTAVILLYAADGEPVGSGLLSEYLDLQLSTATLRNEMLALTKLGFLSQPHTSAGRIPSTYGYRYYTDNLMHSEQLSEGDKYLVDDLFSYLDYEQDRLLQGAAAGLTEIAGYTAVISSPRQPDFGFVHYDVLQVGRYSAAVLGVSQSGAVYMRVANARESLTAEDITFLSVFFNTQLTFLSAKDITQEKITDVARRLGTKAPALLPVVSCAVRLLNEMNQPHVYVENMERLLDYRDLDSSLRGVISLFGDKSLLEDIITRGSADIQVLFGEELPGYYLPGLCLLSAKYAAGGGKLGAVALAGSTRMQHTKLIPLLKYFAEKLGHAVAGTGKKE